MSSRAGPRAVGTDGSDFNHRERVASHYKLSAANKSRMRTIAGMHISLFVLMILRLSANLLSMFSMKPPQVIAQFHLPSPELWEYIWLVSFLALIFALLALPKNQGFLLKQYIIGTVIFGIGPITYGVYDKSFELLDYLQTRKTSASINGLPLVVLWFIFFTIAIQIHGFGVYFSMQLVKAWKPKYDKKVK